MEIPMRILNRKKHPAPLGGKRQPFRNVSSEPLYKRNPVPTRGRSGHLYRDEVCAVLMAIWFVVLAIAMCWFDIYELWGLYRMDESCGRYFWLLFILILYISAVVGSTGPVNYKVAIIVLIILFVVTHGVFYFIT
jgi:hypothetical protein